MKPWATSLALLVTPILAQSTQAQSTQRAGPIPIQMLVDPFAPAGITTLAATSVTSNVILSGTGASVLVTNAGPATAFVALGSNTVTATTTSIPIAANGALALALGSNTYLAGITASGAAALTAQTGTGLPVVVNVNGGISSTPYATSVQGSLAVSTSSVAVSTLTLSPNSRAWAMPPPNGGMLTVKNNGDSIANIRVCWFGSTCTAGATSNGKAIEPGASSSVRLTGSTSPTVICDAAAACNISITE